jgi:hypothetical protein
VTTNTSADERTPTPAPIEDLATLRAEFPVFKIWKERTPGRVRYVARRLRGNLHPHTVVTSDLGELRNALELARADGTVPVTTAPGRQP